MRLHSGLPYWIIKNRLYDYYNPLGKDICTDVAVIGGGITGALAAHALCRSGLECCLIDKRSIATGSSAASTALLQYEIDVPLHRLSEMIGEAEAVMAYRSCLQSISDLENILRDAGVNADFERRTSLFCASDAKGADVIEKEYEIRRRNGLPAVLVSKDELLGKYGVHSYTCALANGESAQVDAYKAAVGLIEYDMEHFGLRVFTHTDISLCEQGESGCILADTEGNTVRCKYVVIAAGFEAGRFLPEDVMKLTSTYAVISHPVSPEKLWKDRALIWETADPYIYMRTSGSRIIMGGEDDDFFNPKKRDRRIGKKVEILESKFRKLFPEIPFSVEMAWCGTFSTTDDGLPFIGPWNDGDRIYFDLGYGGNGITFSVIGSQILARAIHGRQKCGDELFGFGRQGYGRHNCSVEKND